MPYAPWIQKRVANLLDGADVDSAKPWLASGQPPLASGGYSTVSTNYGDLDAETVMHNRVGGVGVVHILADTPATK